MSNLTTLTAFNLPIGTNSAHREGGDDADDGRERDDEQGEADTSLRHHPRDAQKQHHTPDVQKTWYKHTLYNKQYKKGTNTDFK